MKGCGVVRVEGGVRSEAAHGNTWFGAGDTKARVWVENPRRRTIPALEERTARSIISQEPRTAGCPLALLGSSTRLLPRQAAERWS